MNTKEIRELANSISKNDPAIHLLIKQNFEEDARILLMEKRVPDFSNGTSKFDEELVENIIKAIKNS